MAKIFEIPPKPGLQLFPDSILIFFPTPLLISPFPHTHHTKASVYLYYSCPLISLYLSFYEALTPPGNSPPPPLTQSVFTGFRRFSADSHRFRRFRRCCVAGFAMKGGKLKAAEVKRADSK